MLGFCCAVAGMLGAVMATKEASRPSQMLLIEFMGYFPLGRTEHADGWHPAATTLRLLPQEIEFDQWRLTYRTAVFTQPFVKYTPLFAATRGSSRDGFEELAHSEPAVRLAGWVFLERL